MTAVLTVAMAVAVVGFAVLTLAPVLIDCLIDRRDEEPMRRRSDALAALGRCVSRCSPPREEERL